MTNTTIDFGETWIAKNWRPLAAIVYLIICFTDFVGMPIYYEYSNHRYTPEAMVTLAMKMPPATQIDALKLLRTEDMWQPLTLSQSGLFHIAFGAILGVSAWSRGSDKQAQLAATLASLQTSTQTPPSGS